MTEESQLDLERLLADALRPIEPPDDLATRVESTLTAITEQAAAELASWAEELSEGELDALRDPRNWVRPVAAAAAGTLAGGALVVVGMRRRRRSSGLLASGRERAQAGAAGLRSNSAGSLACGYVPGGLRASSLTRRHRRTYRDFVASPGGRVATSISSQLAHRGGQRLPAGGPRGRGGGCEPRHAEQQVDDVVRRVHREDPGDRRRHRRRSAPRPRPPGRRAPSASA